MIGRLPWQWMSISESMDTAQALDAVRKSIERVEYAGNRQNVSIVFKDDTRKEYTLPEMHGRLAARV